MSGEVVRADKKAASDIDPRRARARELIDPWSEEWGEALRHAINVNGQPAIPVALVEIEPFMASMFSITRVAAPSGIAAVSDHVLETDGATWSTTCLHGDDQEKFFHPMLTAAR